MAATGLGHRTVQEHGVPALRTVPRARPPVSVPHEQVWPCAAGAPPAPSTGNAAHPAAGPTRCLLPAGVPADQVPYGQVLYGQVPYGPGWGSGVQSARTSAHAGSGSPARTSALALRGVVPLGRPGLASPGVLVAHHHGEQDLDGLVAAGRCGAVMCCTMPAPPSPHPRKPESDGEAQEFTGPDELDLYGLPPRRHLDACAHGDADEAASSTGSSTAAGEVSSSPGPVGRCGETGAQRCGGRLRQAVPLATRQCAALNGSQNVGRCRARGRWCGATR